MTKEIYENVAFFNRIFNKAVQKAKTETKEKGLYLVFVRNGQIMYELPNCMLVNKLPEEYK